MTLAFKASATDNAIQLAVIRSGFRQEFVQTGVTIAIDGQSIETSALSYPTGGNAKRVTHLINVDPAIAATLRTAKALRVSVKQGVNDVFPLEPTLGVWGALQDCVARIQGVWNIGDKYRDRIATPAQADLKSLFFPGDYPNPAVRSWQQGTAAFLILIDENGLPKDCTIVGSSGSAAINSRSCGIILVRGKFTPAAGRDGKPIKSAREARINWSMK